MEWEKWGLFVSLVTPLILGVGAWIIDALNKRKKKKPEPEVLQGLPVDYETDYVNLLKRNLADARKDNNELRARIRKLEQQLFRSDNGNSDNRPEK
jgi:hypothetical protein